MDKRKPDILIRLYHIDGDGWKDYTLRTGTALWESASGVEPEVVSVEKAICISLSSPRFS